MDIILPNPRELYTFRPMSIHVLGLILANVFWAGSYSIMKWGVAEIHPLSLVCYRMTLAALILWPIVILFFRDQLKKIDRMFVLRIILVTSFDLFFQAGTCIGLRYASASDASLIISMEPVFLFFIATLVLGESLRARHIFSILIALTGFFVLSGLGSIGAISFTNAALAGNVIILFAVVFESGFSIFFKPIVKSFSPIFLLAFVTAFQSLALAPLSYYYDPSFFATSITFKSAAVVGYLAVFCTILGYLIWLSAMKKIPVNIMAFFLFLQPVLGPVIAMLALGEKITSNVLVGGVIIVLALYIAVFRKSEKVLALKQAKQW